jgi:multiple antibiotic resistance protein
MLTEAQVSRSVDKLPDNKDSWRMLPENTASAFLLAFPALFSIVNPIAGAFIFREATAQVTRGDRHHLAGRVAFYSLLVLLTALWTGSYVLAFFGISLAALRIAGGIVLSLFAWNLLSAPEQREARKQEQAAPVALSEDPLTLPFTTGPGTISVAIALSAGHPNGPDYWLPFFIGVSLAAVCVAVTIWIAYRYADRLSSLLGTNGSRTVTRLSAFLLFCIGVQILITGATDVLTPLLGAH